MENDRNEQREYFDDVESAMAALPVPLEARQIARDTIRGVAHDSVWINPGRGYVALSRRGEKVAAYMNRGFVDVLRGSEYVRTELPGFVARQGRGHIRLVERERATCPVHHVALPANGVCDDCA